MKVIRYYLQGGLWGGFVGGAIAGTLFTSYNIIWEMISPSFTWFLLTSITGMCLGVFASTQYAKSKNLLLMILGGYSGYTLAIVFIILFYPSNILLRGGSIAYLEVLGLLLFGTLSGSLFGIVVGGIIAATIVTFFQKLQPHKFHIGLIGSICGIVIFSFHLINEGLNYQTFGSLLIGGLSGFLAGRIGVSEYIRLSQQS